MKLSISIIGCAIVLALPCGAQNVTGSISGTVWDASGQLVPRAAATISKGERRSAWLASG